MNCIISTVSRNTAQACPMLRCCQRSESLLGTPSQFAARLRTTSERPSLLLEEIEGYLEDIYCGEENIELTFINAETLRIAYREYSTIGQFSLITSHDSCNLEGERSAHLYVYCTPQTPQILIVLVYQRSPSSKVR